MENFVEKIFNMNLGLLPRWKQMGVRVLQFLLALRYEFNNDKCIVRSSGLAYTSLLALVPLITVIFAIFSSFSSFDDMKEKIQTLLFSQFLPTRQDEILKYFETFTENTKALGMIGSLALLLTAVLLLDNIEKNFNDIWVVKYRRNIFAKLTSYTSVLVFGALFIGASVSVTAKLKSMLHFDEFIEVGLVSQLSLYIFPFFMSFLAFLVMYVLIPYTKVSFKSATVGAFVGGLLWELAKNWFSGYAGQSVKYSVIYGSLALIPIFLIWLYITWIIVLIGLEVTYVHQNFKALISHRRFKDLPGKEQLNLVLRMFTFIATRFHRGDPPPTISDLADRFDVPLEVADQYANKLVDNNLVNEVTRKNDGLAPAKSLENIKVIDIIGAVFNDPGKPETKGKSLEKTVDDTLSDFEKAGYGAVGEQNMLAYIKTIEGQSNS